MYVETNVYLTRHNLQWSISLQYMAIFLLLFRYN